MPWYLIEFLDKKCARIRALQIVTDDFEKAVEENVVRGMKNQSAKMKETKKSRIFHLKGLLQND